MLMPTDVQAIRLALVSLVAVLGVDESDETGGCAEALDAAANGIGAMPLAILGKDGADPVLRRFEALRELGEVCAACRACPRGQLAAADLMTKPRPPGPPRWRSRR